MTARVIVLLIVALTAGLASAADTSAPPPAVHYPLDTIHSDQDLLGRLMCPWGAGLPGHPRYNGTHIHAGLDVRATLGEPVLALVDGVVDPRSDTLHSGYGPGWTKGWVMIVRSPLPDGGSFLIVYGHTQNHRVVGGTPVKAGDVLAEVGPWLATEGGPHLHLTVRMPTTAGTDGDLPRYGWGTPTLAGCPVREGAESAATEEDLVRLGYRNPLTTLWGGLVTDGGGGE